MAAPAPLGTGADPEDCPAGPAGYGAGQQPEAGQPPRRRLFTATVLIFSVIVTAAAVYAVLTHAGQQRTARRYQVPAVFSLRAGDCFDFARNAIAVTIRACSTPHDAEVFAASALPASAWPGADRVRSMAEAACDARIASYMSPDLAFDHQAIYPDQVTWQAGVRTVICAVTSPDGPVTGSVRQASPAATP